MGTEGSEYSRSGGNKKKSRNKGQGIEELQGHQFMIGVPGQEQKFITTRRAIAAYVGREFRKEFYTLVEEGTEPTFDRPKPPTDSNLQAEYQMELKLVMGDERSFKRDKGRVFLVILEQCAVPLRNKLERLSEYKTLNNTNDVVGLMGKIQGLAYSTEGAQHPYWKLQASVRKLVAMEQYSGESLASYGRRFEEQQEQLEQLWGPLTPSNMKGKKTEEQEAARNKFLACLFLGGCDRGRFEKTIDDLNNDFVAEKDSYPKDVESMQQLLENRRGGGGRNKQADALMDGLRATSFVQQDFHRNKKCFHCGKKGHIARDCPEKARNQARTDENDSHSDDESSQSSHSQVSSRRGPRIGWHGGPI